MPTRVLVRKKEVRPCGSAAGSEEEGYVLTRDFVVAMLEHFRAQKNIHRRFALQIILQARGPCICHAFYHNH
jgi:hypothetical protein